MITKAHLLLVEDDFDQLSITREWLEKEGYIISFAGNTEEARGLLSNPPFPDLMILDMMMTTPTEGFEFATALRKDEKWRHLPIILLTGMAGSSSFPGDFASIMGREWPVSKYLEKPVTRERLLEEVKTLLQSRSKR